MAAASSYLLSVMTAILFLWVFSCGNVEASIDFGNMTALQKHVEFFDRNKNGIITPSELYEEFELTLGVVGYIALGCDAAFARKKAASISAAVGPKTSPENAPVSIYVQYIHKAMHGSDTGAYDDNGRFLPSKFEQIFTKHAKVTPDALTYEEIQEMILANRDPQDPQSWSAPPNEWGLTYRLASDKMGFLHKDSARGIYDGSLFYMLEEQRTPATCEM